MILLLRQRFYILWGILVSGEDVYARYQGGSAETVEFVEPAALGPGPLGGNSAFFNSLLAPPRAGVHCRADCKPHCRQQVDASPRNCVRTPLTVIFWLPGYPLTVVTATSSPL